ncbi:hypothetical protein RclHR1_02730013 [Rhizophagus clarus]|uniref:F-box domain-containing protein n=1 Tax=Rhizophagus clarus TaxID=94130 RepID=A0A2Z6RHG0_9GLOM|nr:hypothetical protein RclHR1_02730013 [Rhizophagus clarus]GES81140.1 hypothetical protein GLOIN_2v1876445 [Rhizophagus clarus]
MPCQLPADCLNEIFEYLERKKRSLYSCLLVNRFWCEISVRILWRDVWDTKSAENRLIVNSLILNTLIICLPNNSKIHLLEKGILDSTQISKTPLFDYPSFCKVLSIIDIGQTIVNVFKSQNYLAKEIMKMFMTKTSLKKLYYHNGTHTINLSFLRYPGAKDYLTNLSKLNCSSDVKNTFFNILSQVCCNIQSLTIEFKEKFSNDLKNLISSQNNLKYLSLSQKRSYSGVFWSAISPSLAKHSKSLIKLKIHWLKFDHWDRTEQLSLFTTFTNLQEIILSFHHRDGFSGFNKLQYITFPQLQTLKFLYKCPDDDMLIKFLKNNGRNLKEFYVNSNSNLILSAIAEFCPNLKLLYALFRCDKIETYKVILNSCQQLESIETRRYYGLLSEKELLETLAKYSPKNFYRLKLINYSDSKLIPEDLEKFFSNWKDRVPQIPFSFINRGSFSLENKEGISDVIEKYKKLGTIKKFETTLY